MDAIGAIGEGTRRSWWRVHKVRLAVLSCGIRYVFMYVETIVNNKTPILMYTEDAHL